MQSTDSHRRRIPMQSTYPWMRPLPYVRLPTRRAPGGQMSCSAPVSIGRPFRGHPRPSEAIRGHPRPSEAIRGHLRSSEAIRGHPRPSEVIRGQSDAIRCKERTRETLSRLMREAISMPSDVMSAPARHSAALAVRSSTQSSIGRSHSAAASEKRAP